MKRETEGEGREIRREKKREREEVNGTRGIIRRHRNEWTK